MAVITYREALNQALREEMQRDPRVVLIGEDIGLFEGAYKVTAGLYKEFGENRVMDSPIAEEVIVGAGIGAAMLGLKPVVEIMTVNFILLAIDQIVNNAAKLHDMFAGMAEAPVVIRTPQGAGQQLAAQHSQCFDVFFAHVPGLKVVAPAFPDDAKGLLKAAIRARDPVIFLEHLSLYNTRGEVPDGDYTVPLGTARLVRPGSHLTIIAHSRMTLLALQAADRLSQLGIEAEVIDLRSLRPLPREMFLESVRRTNRAIVVEENWRSFGVGAEVAATIQEEAFDYLDAPVLRVATKEVPMPYAKSLEQKALPQVQDILEAALRTLGKEARSLH
jgi:pyruvate dehydrogenase E1 component beta subunit